LTELWINLGVVLFGPQCIRKHRRSSSVDNLYRWTIAWKQSVKSVQQIKAMFYDCCAVCSASAISRDFIIIIYVRAKLRMKDLRLLVSQLCQQYFLPKNIKIW